MKTKILMSVFCLGTYLFMQGQNDFPCNITTERYLGLSVGSGSMSYNFYPYGSIGGALAHTGVTWNVKKRETESLFKINVVRSSLGIDSYEIFSSANIYYHLLYKIPSSSKSTVFYVGGALRASTNSHPTLANQDDYAKTTGEFFANAQFSMKVSRAINFLSTNGTLSLQVNSGLVNLSYCPAFTQYGGYTGILLQPSENGYYWSPNGYSFGVNLEYAWHKPGGMRHTLYYNWQTINVAGASSNFTLSSHEIGYSIEFKVKNHRNRWQ